jgi:hypothetical protein
MRMRYPHTPETHIQKLSNAHHPADGGRNSIESVDGRAWGS